METPSSSSQKTEPLPPLLTKLFWSLVGVFGVTIVGMITLNEAPWVRAGFLPIFMLVVAILLLCLGVALVVLTLKKKVKGKLKWFLILTGASAAGIVIGSVLHNLVYALFILLFGEGFWGKLGDEPFFFTLSVLICPLSFLVGAVGTLVLLFKRRKKLQP